MPGPIRDKDGKITGPMTGKDKKKKIIERAEDYMNRKPETTRNKVAVYAGVAISVLERWGVVLPKPITAKQRIRKSPWTKGHMV